jgi:hypothetical protein
MKVVDYQTPQEGSKKTDTLGRLMSSLGSLQSKTGTRVQETTIQTLKKVLDNRFILLRGLVLPELEPPPPLLLVGPPGTWLIEASTIKGVYRATDDLWEEMDSQTQKFRPAKVNLPVRTASIARTVTSLLNDRGLAIQPIEPVIFFTQPGAHIEATRPVARLIRSDTIVRFAASLLQGKIVLSPEQIQAVIEALIKPTLDTTAEAELDMGELDQDASIALASQKKREARQAQINAALNTDEPEIITRLSRRATFSKRQWLILGALLLVNLLVLIAIIIVVQIIT